VSFAVSAVCSAFCAITGDRLRANVMIHATTEYKLGRRDFILWISPLA
jgi:hypothetical protein